MKKALIAIVLSALIMSTGGIILFAKVIDALEKYPSPYYSNEVNDMIVETSDNEITVNPHSGKSTAVAQDEERHPSLDGLPKYQVFLDDESCHDFKWFSEAFSFAKSNEKAKIYYRKSDSIIWDTFSENPSSHKIKNVEKIAQYPELPRGCEVTSLAMLLNYMDIAADKIALSEEIRKDKTPYSVIDGKIRFGNPHYGFVGSMTDRSEPGFGVYNEPIFDLLEKYAPNTSINMTGADFGDLKFFINRDVPVWVIINVTYQKLPESEFITWRTSYGDVRVTYREHSVLITGYDEHRIYFNDPLMNTDSASYRSFVECWEQMGRQAVTLAPTLS